MTILRRLSRRAVFRGAGAFALLSGGHRAIAASGAPGGFSVERLKLVTAAMQGAVDIGDVGGIVTLLYRRGEIAQVNAVGLQDQTEKILMARDSIFRIASMTKPITCAAALILIEEGKFQLDDPVDRWLPELANPNVIRDPAGPLDSAYPSPRPIRVVDLFTHRSGIVTPRTKPGPLLTALTEADANNASGYDVWLKRIGALPLAHEPGSTFLYGNSIDVLGILVERVSGMAFPEFLRQRVFQPLGMDDTAFWIPPEKQSRAAKLQSLGRVPASWIPDDRKIPGFISAAGGLHSTVDDYLKFARMLLARGKLGNVRVLAERSVAEMTTNRLTPEQRTGGFSPGDGAGYWKGHGFGLGVAVRDTTTVKSAVLGIASIGSFNWPGAFGTWWEADPKEDMIQIVMVPGGKSEAARWAFQAAAYQAIGA